MRLGLITFNVPNPSLISPFGSNRGRDYWLTGTTSGSRLRISCSCGFLNHCVFLHLVLSLFSPVSVSFPYGKQSLVAYQEGPGRKAHIWSRLASRPFMYPRYLRFHVVFRLTPLLDASYVRECRERLARKKGCLIRNGLWRENGRAIGRSEKKRTRLKHYTELV